MSVIYGLVEGVVVFGGLAVLAAVILLIVMVVYNLGIGSRY